MVTYVWLTEHLLLDEWNFVMVECGVQCVMVPGMMRMLELLAGNWDSRINVNKLHNIRFFSVLNTGLSC